ncbi:hypothetical protein BH23ACT5_BH23ACT5_20970 [soil metagenome]
MLEALVAATATTGLFFLARNSRDGAYAVDPRLVVDITRAESELPCPGGKAATAEADDRCPACGRRFG